MAENKKSFVKNELSGYELSKDWFDFCYENPEKINPNHTAMYFFIIEHCNRLGWKEKFGLPMQMTKDAIGIKNYRTFSNTFNDLVEWGFIKLVEKSKNQYSANIVAIVKNAKAHTKALSKAMQKHLQKQVHGIVCIDKHINQELLNKGTETLENENDLPLGYQMQTKFQKENPGYPAAPSKDIPAIIEIAKFICLQITGKELELFEMDIVSIMSEWQKWCDWYSENGNNKSLDYLVKYKLQEIYLEIKNGRHGIVKNINGKAEVQESRNSAYAAGF